MTASGLDDINSLDAGPPGRGGRQTGSEEGEQPDRTPCDFWAEECTWNRLLAHVGHSDRERVLQDLAVDVRHLDVAAPAECAIGDGVLAHPGRVRLFVVG